MSEILKYKKYLNFKANPRYLTRDFIVPLYTGTEPDIYEDKKSNMNDPGMVVDPLKILPKNFTDDMPFVNPKNIPEQLELADGGSVERQGFKFGTRQELIDKMSKAGFDKYSSYSAEPHKFAKLYNIKTKISPGYKTRYSYDIPSDKKLSSILNTIETNRTRPRSGSFKKAQEILNNSKLKKEFIKFGSQQGVTGKQIREKYKLSTSEFFQSGLRDLFDKNFQTDYRASVLPQTIERMKKILSNKKFNKLLNEGILPEHKDLKKTFNFTPNEASTAVLRIGQSFTGQKFENIEDLNILKNKKAGEILLNKISKAPFGNAYSNAARIAVLDKVDSQMGNKVGSFDSFRKSIINNIKDNGLNKKLLKKFDLNEIAGLSAAANNKMAPYAYFVNLVNSKINQGALASFNNLYGRKTDELIKAVSQFKKTGDDTKVKKILNSFEESKNNFLNNISSKARKEIERVGLPGLSINSPEIEFGKRRINQLSKSGLNLPEVFEKTGVTMTVPKGSVTLQDLKTNPEALTRFINTMGCPRTEQMLGGRVNFSNGSNCYVKGLEKIQSGELGTTEKKIAGEFLKQAGAAGEDVQDVFKGTKAGLRFLQDVVVGLTRPVIAANVGISAAAEGENLLRGQLNPASRLVESITFGALGGGPTEVVDQMLEFGSPGTIKTINHSKTIKKFNDQIESEKNDIENANNAYSESGIDPTNIILEKEKNIASIQKQKNEFLSNPTFALTQKDKNDFENDFKKIVKIGLDKGIEGTKKTARFTPEIQTTPNEILIDRERFPNFAFQLATNLKGTEIENILKPYSDIEKSIIDESTFIAKDPELLEIKNYYQDFKNAGDIIYNKSEPLTDEQRIGIEEMGARGGAAEGGRIGLKDGTKIGRRGFLGLIAGAAAAPDLIKAIKGTGQAGKIASKIKLEPAEGMYPWFPKLVEKIKDMGKPFEEKQLIMEPSYKNDPRPFGSRVPTGEEKLTMHVDGDTTFILREYPDGRLAVDIDSPRNQESFGQPVSLYYRPKMEIQNYKGEKKIEPPEFKVLEPEPRPFVTGPDDVDITFTEVPKNPKRDTVFGDIEAAERFATGNIKNRKIIPVKQSLRNEMEEDPSTFIMRQSGELGSEARPEKIIKIPEEKATGGRVGFGGGGPAAIKFARMITDILDSLQKKLSFSSHLEKLHGTEKAKEKILSPYRIPEGTNKSQHSDILTYIEESKQNLPKEYNDIQNTLNEIEKDINNYNYVSADKKGKTLLDKLPDSFNFEKLPQDLFPMEDPLNDAFILFDPKRQKMIGRYTMRYNVDPKTNKGIIETYDTYDPASKKFLEEKDWKLIGVDAREESGVITKEGLN